MRLYKYSGAGNDFLVIDGRGCSEADLERFRSADCISRLCDRRNGLAAKSANGSSAANESADADGSIGTGKQLAANEYADGSSAANESAGADGSIDAKKQLAADENADGRIEADGGIEADRRVGADGFMILCSSTECDFRMEYYNSDGSGGMMCGNGGRCIVAFAAFCGIEAKGGTYHFEAADGMHTAEILSGEPGGVCEVRLGMIDAFGLRETLGGWFLNTGTRHFVKFVPDVEAVDIMVEGAALRRDSEFAPEGANVNFVQLMPDGALKLRTFEKGVEAETLACGTGITAAAIAAHYAKGACGEKLTEGRVSYRVRARIAELSVEFRPCERGGVCAESVFLTGPSKRVDLI